MSEICWGHTTELTDRQNFAMSEMCWGHTTELTDRQNVLP